MRKFIPWIILFVLLLSSVPVLIWNQQLMLAKVVGFVLIVTTVFALRIWLRAVIRKKLTPDSVKFNINHRHFLRELSPIYNRMTSGERKMLEKRMGKLLAELQFDDTTRPELNQEDLLAFALLQILAVDKEEYVSQKGHMVVFDIERNDQNYEIIEGKYLLIHPETSKKILEACDSVASMSTSQDAVIKKLQAFYQGISK